jgi:hypothetical protein
MLRHSFARSRYRNDRDMDQAWLDPINQQLSRHGTNSFVPLDRNGCAPVPLKAVLGGTTSRYFCTSTVLEALDSAID